MVEICIFFRVSPSGKTTSKYEATDKEIHEALKKQILATVDFMYKYKNLNVQLTPEQKTLKNTRVEQVVEFLMELDKVIFVE